MCLFALVRAHILYIFLLDQRLLLDSFLCCQQYDMKQTAHVVRFEFAIHASPVTQIIDLKYGIPDGYHIGWGGVDGDK